MENQIAWLGSSPKDENPKNDKMSLIALLFFMMGALNIYVALRQQKSWLSSLFNPLVRIALSSAILAGAIEFALS